LIPGQERLESKAAASVQLIFPLPASASAKQEFIRRMSHP
jgi:hypothetical protein